MTPLLAQRSRSDRSFERLYRRHVADVYRYALAVMRNQTDAEDVTQTTFLNAFRAFERGERPKKPQNWLIAIAHNVCRQRFRQSARRPTEVSFDEDIGDRFVGAPEEGEGPSAQDIRRALGHLAFNQRAALVMRELEGRSYAEIAEILELTPSAVETLIFRARRALREQLESSLTCGEAELAISRQLDGRLSRADKGGLRFRLGPSRRLRPANTRAGLIRPTAMRASAPGTRTSRPRRRRTASTRSTRSAASTRRSLARGPSCRRAPTSAALPAIAPQSRTASAANRPQVFRRPGVYGVGRAPVPNPRGHAARGSRGSPISQKTAPPQGAVFMFGTLGPTKGDAWGS